MTAASQTIASISYEATVTLAPESPAGAGSVCNISLTGSLGFWSVLGDLPVPVVLSVARNPLDSQAVDLSWSGNAPLFQVFRSYAPQNIVQPGNLDRTTAVCTATDPLAFQSNIIYYVIEE